MLRYVDSHIHLSDKEYSGCEDELVADAKSANVVGLVSSSMDLKTSIGSLKLAEQYRGLVFAALGVHPWTVQTLTDNELDQTIDFIAGNGGNRSLIAVGEIGLDVKYEKILDRQMKVFSEMLQLAEKLDLPAIIHSRGMIPQIVDMLPSYSVKKVLLHWFSNPISCLSKAMERGYFITEGLPTVFSKGIREVVRKAALDRLITETDGPVRFSRPPFNGKRTTPAHIPTVVRAIAEIKQMSTEDVASEILRNFERFFNVNLLKTES